MSVDSEHFTLIVRVGDRSADLTFEGVLLDDLRKHVDAAIANRAECAKAGAK